MGDQLLAQSREFVSHILLMGLGATVKQNVKQNKNVVCQRENKIQFSTSPNQETIINQYEKHQTTGSINFDDN